MAYVGDDLMDIPVMEEVGLSFAVANAINAVKKWQAIARKNKEDVVQCVKSVT